MLALLDYVLNILISASALLRFTANQWTSYLQTERYFLLQSQSFSTALKQLMSIPLVKFLFLAKTISRYTTLIFFNDLPATVTAKGPADDILVIGLLMYRVS